MLLMQSEENRVVGNGAEVLFGTWVCTDTCGHDPTVWRSDEDMKMKKSAIF